MRCRTSCSAMPPLRLVEDRYFDTARGALRRHGFAARLRRSGGGRDADREVAGRRGRAGATPAPPDALHRRASSWKAPRTPRLDPDAGRRARPGSWSTSCGAAARLRALFTIRQRRAVRDIRADDGDRPAVARRGRGARRTDRRGHLRGAGDRVDRRADASLLGRLGARARRQRPGVAGDRAPRSSRHASWWSATTPRSAARRLPRVPRTPGVTADDPLSEAGRKVLADAPGADARGGGRHARG